MAVQFKPKPGKPHFKIMSLGGRKHFLGWVGKYDDRADRYVRRVCQGDYKTKGEAARALHYGRKYI